jgi:lysosomal Pro-X carboxypeptidase
MADEEIFDYVRKGIEVYYNYEQTQKCNEVQGPDQSADADMSGWNILACADMVMPMGSDGVNDMFNPQPWDYEAYTKMC